MTTELSDKLRSVNVLMTILIVALHSNMQELYPIKILTDIAVPTFFCISAFLYFQNWQPTWQLYVKKLRSRFRSLFIPYVTYNLLFYLYYIVKIHLFHLPVAKVIPTDPWDAVLCILNSVPDNPFWFIKALLFFILMAPLFGWIIKSYRMAVLPIIIIGIICSNYVAYHSVLYWIPCFALGCFFAIYEEDIKRWYGRWKVNSPLSYNFVKGNGLLLFLTYYVLCCIIFTDETISDYYYFYRITTPLIVLIVYMGRDPLPGEFVKKAGPYTFYAFGIHDMFIWNIHGILLKLNYITEQGQYPLEFPFILICTLALIWLTGSLLMKIPTVWRLLTGFRK